MTINTPEYLRCYAVAKSIPSRKNKRPAILFWFKCAKKMLKASKDRGDKWRA